MQAVINVTCGVNPTTLIIPPTTPSVTREISHEQFVCDKNPLTAFFISGVNVSVTGALNQCPGPCTEIQKVSHIAKANSGSANHRLRTTSSIFSVMFRLRVVEEVHCFAICSAMRCVLSSSKSGMLPFDSARDDCLPRGAVCPFRAEPTLFENVVDLSHAMSIHISSSRSQSALFVADTNMHGNPINRESFSASIELFRSRRECTICEAPFLGSTSESQTTERRHERPESVPME